MEIILKEDVQDLGQIGDVIKVKSGYARNFLIPKGLAAEANPRNIKVFEHEKKKIQKLAKKAMTDAKELASRLSTTPVTIKVKTGKSDKLFGSVTAMDIADALKKEGVDIDRKKILLEESIRRLGNYTVSVKIYPDVSAQLNVQVVSER
ncbi:50S ribosomal protein L9 [Thermodesulfovibrionales bacterium]|nr:50S ribosomal protein L9 [Thermodesulfovibrionales bacterium]